MLSAGKLRTGVKGISWKSEYLNPKSSTGCLTAETNPNYQNFNVQNEKEPRPEDGAKQTLDDAGFCLICSYKSCIILAGFGGN